MTNSTTHNNHLWAKICISFVLIYNYNFTLDLNWKLIKWNLLFCLENQKDYQYSPKAKQMIKEKCDGDAYRAEYDQYLLDKLRNF